MQRKVYSFIPVAVGADLLSKVAMAVTAKLVANEIVEDVMSEKKTETPITAPTPPEEKGWWQKTKDWAKERPVLGGALAGGAGGAAVGTVVPGLGTAIGAVVGAAGGAVSGALHKKAKDK